MPPESFRQQMVSQPDLIDEHLLQWQRFTRQALTDAQVGMVRDMYDSELAFVDQELGRLLDRLTDDTLLVVTGDHGEEFLDHGGFLHGHTLYEELLHVPMLIRGPGVCANRRVSEVVSHVDLTPTLLELVGLELPVGLSGQSLVPLLNGDGRLDNRLVFSVREWEGVKSVAARSDHWKVIVHGRQYELFNLAVDAGELSDVASQKSDVLKKFLSEIDTREERLVDGPEFDDEWRDERIRQLKALGYI